jgi:thiamine transporter ThiT
MTFSLDIKKSVITGIIVGVVALIVGYFIFARTRGGGELISVPAILGLSQGFFKNLGNSVRGEYLTAVRIKMLVTGLVGFGLGFVGGSIRK